MNNTNEVIVYTYPTRELSGDEEAAYGRAPYTYRRIAAIESTRGQVVCRGIGQIALTPEVLRLGSADQANRFKQYFTDTIVPNDIRLRGSKVRPEADYNCHGFAEAVAGDGVSRPYREAIDRVEERRASCRDLRGRLAVGALGFVLCHRGQPEILHSFIGLGEHTNECLSVLCIGGPVAIASYQSMRDDYITLLPQLVALRDDT